MGLFVGSGSFSCRRVPSSQKSSASRANISLASSGKSPDWVSAGFASVCSSAHMTLTSGAFVKVEPPVTTHSRPRARRASM